MPFIDDIPLIMPHPLAARVKKPVGMFGSGLFAIKPPSHRSNKQNGRLVCCGQGIPSCRVAWRCSCCFPQKRPISLFVGETRSERVDDKTTDTSEDQTGNRVPRTLEVLHIVTKEGISLRVTTHGGSSKDSSPFPLLRVAFRSLKPALSAIR